MKAFAIGFMFAAGFTAFAVFPIIQRYSYEAVLNDCKQATSFQSDYQVGICNKLLAAQQR